jgi:hypothetical protein
LTAWRVAKLSLQSSTTSAPPPAPAGARLDPLGQGRDLHAGVDLLQGFASRFDLGLAHARGGVHDLALQVGEIDGVVIHQRDVAYPGRGQVHGRRRAQAAGTDHQGMALQQAGLAFDVDLVEQDVARVAQQLLVIHRHIRHG